MEMKETMVVNVRGSMVFTLCVCSYSARFARFKLVNEGRKKHRKQHKSVNVDGTNGCTREATKKNT